MSSSVRAGFWAGLLAGGVATTAITLGLFTDGLPVLALALWERTLRVIPMNIFSFFIVRLKFAAKPSAYWGMLATATVLWAILGAMLGGRRTRPLTRAVVAWGTSAAVLLGLTYAPAAQAIEARRSAVGDTASAAGEVLLAIALIALSPALSLTPVAEARSWSPLKRRTVSPAVSPWISI